MLALDRTGPQRELQLRQLAVGQRILVEHALPGRRQQFFIGEDNPVKALRRDGKDAAAEGVAAGVLQQCRIDPGPDRVLVGLQCLLPRDDAGLLQLAPVEGADLLGDLGRLHAGQGVLRQGRDVAA